MSYSYNDLLHSIITSRQSHPNTIHETLSHYGTFSDKCSMTPLLWIQYAQDSKSMDGDLAKEIIQLGIEEFPGCVLLWMYYLDCAKDWGVWEEAMKSIRGLQGNVMLEFYRLGVKCFPSRTEELLVDRATFMIAGNEGITDEISGIVTQLKNIEGSIDNLLTRVDEGRRFASQNMSLLSRLEEDIAAAMDGEGIHPPASINLRDFLIDHCHKDSNGMLYDWDGILTAIGGIEGNCLMGAGMMQSASSFLAYVQQIFKHVKFLKRDAARSKEEDDASMEQNDEVIKFFQNLIVPIYERAIAECPTVEMIWEKYLKHLKYVLHDSEADSSDRIQALVKLKSVSSRAVKNCPYSVKLFTMKMQVIVEEVEAGRKILEPDDLMSIVTEAVDGGFLPDKNSHLQVYMEACRIVKRRVLDLVSRATSPNAYDQPERLNRENRKKRKGGGDIELRQYILPLEDEKEQEVRDLVEDLREMWIATDAFLRNKYKDWSEGRQVLFTEIAETEAYVCSPLVSNDNHRNEAIKSFEKLVRVHHPPHPNSWRYFIRYLMGKSFAIKDHEDDDVISEAPGMTVGKLRFIRNLYQRALSSFKKGDSVESTSSYEYEAAASLLYQEFIEFEKMFGSENSIATASKLVAKKISHHSNADAARFSPENLNATDDGGTNEAKRKREDFNEKEEHIGSGEKIKKQKTMIDTEEKGEDIEMEIVEEQISSEEIPDMETATKKGGPNIWPIKPKAEHKIKIGNLEYPAHPFTVHVSNLSHKTLDMDLYDLFKSKCGAIVHVRIFREKQRRHRPYGDELPTSKGAGLIQFEERESVENALKLSGEIGLHEKLIKVTRSHQPAVGVVPPGCHRVKPKGQGKNTQLNLKRKERRKKEILKKEEAPAASHDAESAAMKAPEEGNRLTPAQESRGVTSSTDNSSILAFRPRNVGNKRKNK